MHVNGEKKKHCCFKFDSAPINRLVQVEWIPKLICARIFVVERVFSVQNEKKDYFVFSDSVEWLFTHFTL